MTHPPSNAYSSGIVAVHLLIMGLYLTVNRVSQTVVHSWVRRDVRLKEKSLMFEAWKNPRSSVYVEFYFFNVTNPEEFLTGGRAAVTQIGPYTYREHWARENMTFLDNGTKLHTMTSKTFVFVPDKSAGDPEVDLVRTINIPVVSVMSKMASYPFLLRPLLSAWMDSNGMKIFMTHTVHEVLWGYEDPLLQWISLVQPDVDHHFGLMWRKNGTLDGGFVFHTGEENHLDYGKIFSWNGLRELSWWSSSESNMINGTDGTLFHPLLSRNELLYIFAADLCRSIHLAYVEDVNVRGIEAYRFSPPADLLASPSENPANQGFCQLAEDCLGSGLLDVSVCRDGAPIVMSLPHFYGAERRYRDAIDGLRPTKEDHETYLDVQPTFGFPLRASIQVQLNVLLSRVSGFFSTSRLNRTVFPVMFVKEKASIDEASASTVRTLLFLLTLVSSTPLFIVGVGFTLLLLSLVLSCWSAKSHVETDVDLILISDLQPPEASSPPADASL